MPSFDYSAFLTQAAADARYQALGSLGSSTPSAIDPDDAGSAGVSTSASRADHQHGAACGTPTNIGLTGVNSEGSGTSLARDTHVHAYTPPACRVFHNTTQSIAHNVDQVLVFNSERYDTDSMHSTSVLTERITINTAGLYVFTFTGQMATAVDYTTLYTYIRLNGATIIGIGPAATGTTSAVADPVSVTTVYKCAAGDYVEVLQRQNNGATAARNMLQANNYSPEFTAVWIGVG